MLSNGRLQSDDRYRRLSSTGVDFKSVLLISIWRYRNMFLRLFQPQFSIICSTQDRADIQANDLYMTVYAERLLPVHKE